MLHVPVKDRKRRGKKKGHLRVRNMSRSLSLPILILMNPGLSRIFCI